MTGYVTIGTNKFDALHAKALELGGSDEGSPDDRGNNVTGN